MSNNNPFSLTGKQKAAFARFHKKEFIHEHNLEEIPLCRARLKVGCLCSGNALYKHKKSGYTFCGRHTIMIFKGLMDSFGDRVHA